VLDMALFATIPDTLFSPLASPGVPAYAAALLQIFAETRRHQQPLSRELAVSLAREVLAETQSVLDATDAGDVGALEGVMIRSRLAPAVSIFVFDHSSSMEQAPRESRRSD
jgi:hypothetical protein